MRVLPLCLMCRNLHTAERSGGPGACDAFPDGIPAEIWENEVLHLSDYPGDDGVRFEAIPGMEESAAGVIQMLDSPDRGEPREPSGPPSGGPGIVPDA